MDSVHLRARLIRVLFVHDDVNQHRGLDVVVGDGYHPVSAYTGAMDMERAAILASTSSFWISSSSIPAASRCSIVLVATPPPIAMLTAYSSTGDHRENPSSSRDYRGENRSAQRNRRIIDLKRGSASETACERGTETSRFGSEVRISYRRTASLFLAASGTDASSSPLR